MEDFAVLPASETALLGQDILIGSLWNRATALENSASLTGVLSLVQCTARTESNPTTSKSGPGTPQRELYTGRRDAFDNPSLFRQSAVFEVIAASTTFEREAARETEAVNESSASPVVDSLIGTNRNAVAGSSTTEFFKWETVAPSPIERSEGPPSAVVNDKLYVFGGFYNNQYQATKRSDVYNPATNKWTRIADMPIAVTHLNAAVDGQTIWFAGGFQGNHPGPAIDDVWKYSVVSDTWSKGPSLPEVRGGGALVRLGQELHYFGGYKADRETTVGDHWVLSLEGGTTWTTAAPLPNPRGHLGGEALGGKIYAIGGAYGHHKDPVDLDAVHAYDPATNTWKAVANLPIPRSHFESSTTIFNNRLLVIGGRSKSTGQTALNHVTEYDPATNTWITLPSLPVDLIAPVAKMIGDQLIVTNGGLNRTTSPQSTTHIGVFANKWESSTAMPTALGEAAGGIIGNKLYQVGEGSSATLAYNLSTGKWSGTLALAQRPFVGHHHAAEVFNKKLYLFGGLGNGAGKVQIYNPSTNKWSLGANMPFAAGSSSSTVINKQIYVAGGILDSSTTNQVARYNPATNTWKLLAPMKQGRNHAASATDGTKLYVFGGRDSGNVPSNGFNTVQIYNPTTNSWTSSSDSGSTLAPLPQARGGMGKAVYFNNEFYMMGGETQDGAGATDQKVYDRVDIYNPLTNQWRLGTPMPTARHGIFPLLLAGRIHVAGGGTRAGHSSSSLFEIYNPSTANLVNKAPSISLTGEALSYTENAEAVVVENGATVSDPDSTNFDMGTLTVHTANGTPDDRLGIRNQGMEAGQIGVFGSNLTYGGTTIGTFSGGTGGSTPLVITFNPSASISAVEVLMNSITYENISDNPLIANRTVSFVLTDGDGGTSNGATKAINITAVNDSPVLVTNSGLTLNQGAMAVISNSLLRVSDADHSVNEVIYTVTDLPDYGTLMLNGIVIATIGDTFTQADIDADKLTCTHDGSATANDSFTLIAADSAGSAIAATIVDITLTLDQSLASVNLGRNKFPRS